MAPLGSLTGRHPAVLCLDVVMRCDTGLSHLDYVDPTCRALECAYCPDFRHRGTRQIFNFSRGK